MDARYGSLPFDEAIRYFRQKITLPTQAWTDVWQGMHARAFVVAGATRSELLCDLRLAIDKAIADGTTLADFRKDFDAAVKRAGWSYKGSRGWRTSTIYGTNLSVAYSAGRYAQINDPAMRAEFPYWRYRTMDDARVRPLHASWNNIVLPANDPWWDTHYPPNGWSCRCWVEPVTREMFETLKNSPRFRTVAPDDGTFNWTNPNTGDVVRVPNGIDPGWAYNPGQAAYGQNISADVMNRWKKEGVKVWEPLSTETAESIGRPVEIPLDETRVSLGEKLPDAAAAYAAIKNLFGGENKTFFYPQKDFTHSLVVDAKSLSGHIDLSRTPFLPLFAEALSDPFEIWLSFEKNKMTGKVVLRERLIKGFKTDKKKHAMLAVFQSRNGLLESWTIIPSSDMKYTNKQRTGKLVYYRK
jgi:hypothetical protein